MKSKGRVGVFTQRSGQPGKQGILLCMQMIGISQVLLNWPVQLGWWSWEHLVCSASCVRRMYQPKCSLQNVFFSPHTPSKQPANGLAFQEKKKIKVLFILGKSVQEEQFQPCWCVHHDLFWANPCTHPCECLGVEVG